ncbi:MAG: bifunctional DNA-formamidopyrimidine glycosylase/DNA-(apurinic or apyrimidinic site) lyase [candidate division Zixibacteria bacterium]
MPELPEVQTIIDDISKRIVGKTIKDVAYITNSIWRNEIPERTRFLKARVSGLERKGKHILVHLSDDHTLIIHLKMTGKLTVCRPDDPIIKHTHFIVRFARMELRFNDIRRFGYLDFTESSRLNDLKYLADLGPDALGISEYGFVNLVRSKNSRIKSLLLDQNSISGLGNIYADEALYAAGINPTRKSSGISPARIKRLHLNIVVILKKALASRGSSVSDYVDGSGKQGEFQNFHRVYGRTGKPCNKCGSSIKKKTVAGRSSHYCPRCQR